jgi:hypothetical protein
VRKANRALGAFKIGKTQDAAHRLPGLFIFEGMYEGVSPLGIFVPWVLEGEILGHNVDTTFDEHVDQYTGNDSLKAVFPRQIQQSFYFVHNNNP